MTRTMHLAAILAFGAGVAVASAVLAQGASPPAAAPSAQPNVLDAAAAAEAARRKQARDNPPTYSVPAPSGSSSSGAYLPGVVGGYVKSATVCATVGCDDGPQVTPPSGPHADPDNPPPPPSINPGPHH